MLVVEDRDLGHAATLARPAQAVEAPLEPLPPGPGGLRRWQAVIRRLGASFLFAGFLVAMASAATAEPPAPPPAPDRPLLCCDGTLSPSCKCNGPRKGCCSHHHGVCGCAGDE
jgi:hypothetical protein